MAMRAPQYEPLQVAPAVGVSGSAPDTGGNALAGLGGALVDVASARADSIASAQRQFDEVAALSAETALTDYTTSRRVDLLNKRGTAAFETHASLLAEWDKEANAIGAKLTSPGARVLFAERSARIRSGLSTASQTFIAGESIRYDDETTDRAVESQRAAALAAAAVGDVDGFTAALDAQAGVVRGRYARQPGRLDPTQVDADVRAAQSATVADAIDGFLSRGEDQYAAAGLAAFGDRMDPATQTEVAGRVAKAVRIGTVGREADRIVSDALDAEGDVTLAVRESEALANVALLPEDVREDVRKRVKDGFAEARRLEADRQRDAHGVVDRRWQDGESLDVLRMSAEWDTMTPDAQRAQEKLDADRRAGLAEPAEVDPAVYMDIVRQYADPATRGAFAQRDLLTAYPDLTPAQRNEVTGWQDKLRAGGTPDAVDDQIPKMLTVAKDAAQVLALQFAVGPKADRAADAARIEADVFKQMQVERKAALAAGKPWGQAEMADIRNRNLAMIAYGDEGGTKPAFLLVPEDIDEDDITPDRRAFIVGELRARRLPDDDEAIAQAYINLLRYDDVQAPWGAEP